MNNQEIISLYETVAVITDQMLTAARNKDWDQLIALESRCAYHVGTLRKEEPVPLTQAQRERKAKIIRKVLADDREIRNLTEPWMANLDKLMNSASTERKLFKAYGANRTG